MFRTVALLCTGLALAGCASYPQLFGSLSSEPPASESAPAAQAAQSEPGPQRLAAAVDEPADGPRRVARRAAPASPTAEPSERRPSIDELAQVNKSTADQPRQPEASRMSTLPRVGSPEWEKQQAEIERKEKRLDQMIRSICRGC